MQLGTDGVLHNGAASNYSKETHMTSITFLGGGDEDGGCCGGSCIA